MSPKLNYYKMTEHVSYNMYPVVPTRYIFYKDVYVFKYFKDINKSYQRKQVWRQIYEGAKWT